MNFFFKTSVPRTYLSIDESSLEPSGKLNTQEKRKIDGKISLRKYTREDLECGGKTQLRWRRDLGCR